MITLGTGDVDYDAIFNTLRDADIDGLTYVECVGGKILEEINTEASNTTEFLRNKGVM